MSELRRDPLMRRWVIIAPERRVDLFRPRIAAPPATPSEPCPFCPGNESLNPHEIYVVRAERRGTNAPPWWVRITPDQAPLLRVEEEIESRGLGMFDLMSAVGAHELVTDTPDHESHWADFSVEHLGRVLHAYYVRFNDLRRDARIRHLVVLKNHGAPWSRYRHQHSHIVAMPFTAKRVEYELVGADAYFKLKDRCVFCDMLADEEERGVRMVAANEHFAAYAPFASGFPFELWILPRRHQADFGAVPERALGALAAVFHETMTKLRSTLADPHFSLVLHSVPVADAASRTFHWHWELIPHLAGEIGMEWATGVYSNPVAPELAAAMLREGTRLDVLAKR